MSACKDYGKCCCLQRNKKSWFYISLSNRRRMDNGTPRYFYKMIWVKEIILSVVIITSQKKGVQNVQNILFVFPPHDSDWIIKCWDGHQQHCSDSWIGNLVTRDQTVWSSGGRKEIQTTTKTKTKNKTR